MFQGSFSALYSPLYFRSLVLEATHAVQLRKKSVKLKPHVTDINAMAALQAVEAMQVELKGPGAGTEDKKSGPSEEGRRL